MKYTKQTFITLPNRYTLETVSAKAQAVYIWLCCMQDDNGVCWPSIDKLASLTNTSRETVKRATKELEDAGLIARQFSAAHTMKSVNKYEVLVKDTEAVPLDSSNRADRQHNMSRQDTKTAHNEPTMAQNSQSTMAHNEPLTKTISRRTKTNNTANAVGAVAPATYGRPDINDLLDYWHTVIGYPITSKVTANRRAITNLIKKHQVAGVRKLIDGVALAQNDTYAPRVSDFCDLQSKLNQLIAWGQKYRHAKQEQMGEII